MTESVKMDNTFISDRSDLDEILSDKLKILAFTLTIENIRNELNTEIGQKEFSTIISLKRQEEFRTLIGDCIDSRISQREKALGMRYTLDINEWKGIKPYYEEKLERYLEVMTRK